MVPGHGHQGALTKSQMRGFPSHLFGNVGWPRIKGVGSHEQFSSKMFDVPNDIGTADPFAGAFTVMCP